MKTDIQISVLTNYADDSYMQEENEYLSYLDEPSARTIHRTFAFDEWDEKEKNPNEMGSVHVETSNSDTNTPEDQFDRIIRRTLAFDEWDETSIKSANFHTNNEGAFIPVTHDEWDIEINRTTTTATSTTITPSPTSKRSFRIERPFPVYSYESVDVRKFSERVPNLTSTGAPDTAFVHENRDGDCTRARIPHHFLNDDLVEYQYPPPSHNSSPPCCESIPRRASAFHKFSREREAKTPSVNNFNESSSPPQTSSFYSTDPYFQDEEVFESPSSHHSDDVDSIPPQVPEFIVFYNTK